MFKSYVYTTISQTFYNLCTSLTLNKNFLFFRVKNKGVIITGPKIKTWTSNKSVTLKNSDRDSSPPSSLELWQDLDGRTNKRGHRRTTERYPGRPLRDRCIRFSVWDILIILRKPNLGVKFLKIYTGRFIRLLVVFSLKES